MDIKGIFKKDYIIGLDIGSASVKIAQFRKLEDGLHLVDADVREIKQTDDNVIGEKEIVLALKDLFKRVDVKKSKIIASINCSKTAVKIAKAPHMPKAELRDGIRLEAKNYFPFPISSSLLDYEILGDAVEKGVRRYEVAVAVSPRKTVDKYLALLEKAGIKPVLLVPCPKALQKLAEQSYFSAKGGEGKALCFLDIGGLHTELVILKGKAVVFSRKIPVRGKDFTKSMTDVLVSDRGRLELTLDEAEKIKREVGIPPEGESKIIDKKISTVQILSMLRTPLEQLVNEIERCFDYYREESGGGTVDSLVLFGGGASLGGLVKFLSEELGIEVKLGDSLEGFKIESGAIKERGKISYRLELAIGAALSEGKGINLLPPEIKEETKRTFKRTTIETVATAAIFVLAFVYIGMRIQLTNFGKRISVAKIELSSLQPQLEEVEAQRLTNKMLVDEPYWQDIFKELSNIIPNDVYLTELDMEKKVIKMKGIIISEEGEELFSDFILTSEKGIFKNVKLVKIQDIKEKAANEFELKCWVD